MKREVTWCERGRFQTRKAHKIVHISRGNSSSEREEGYTVTSTWSRWMGEMERHPKVGYHYANSLFNNTFL